MTREEFIKRCALMGVGITAFPSILASCSKKDDSISVNFSGKVLVIGAGAAGMMAAYTLTRYGIDFELIEAHSTFGGRVRMNDEFADFPIDLGAEWIHTKPSVFGDMIDNENVDGSIDLIPYRLNTTYRWTGEKLRSMNWVNIFYGEYKFKSTSWYQFFEQFIMPSIESKTRYNSPVTSIDYSNSQIVVEDANSNTYTGDRVIVTVPLTILKNNSISFTPALSQSKQNAIESISMPPGIKVFIKFSKKFYYDLVTDAQADGERLYYDLAFKKDANDHVMGIFNVGDSAADFTDLNSEQEIIDAVMSRLDEMYDGQATQYYQGHIIQNWSAEPYIQGSYSHQGREDNDAISNIAESVNRRLYFAGEALHRDSWSTVHGAGFNGVDVARTILEGK